MRSAWLTIGVLVISVASAQTPSNKQEQVPTAILLSGLLWLSVPRVTKRGGTRWNWDVQHLDGNPLPEGGGDEHIIATD
jgi:hypothetical protein